MHQFEIDAENSIVKSLKDNGLVINMPDIQMLDLVVIAFVLSHLHRYFTAEELHLLLALIREEKSNFRRRRNTCSEWSESTETPIELLESYEYINDIKKRSDILRDPLNRYDTYKTSFETFRTIFAELTSWGKCQNVDLAEKLFRVSAIVAQHFMHIWSNFWLNGLQLMDKQSLGYLDFKQLVLALGIVCSNRITEKLKLLYILHLPPLLCRSEIEAKKDTAAAEEAEEVATEAEDFFG